MISRTSRSVGRRAIGRIFLAALAALCIPTTARADKESRVLRQYRARVDQAVVRGLQWLAMHQRTEGETSGPYAAALYEHLLKQQRPDGHWYNRRFGSGYATALACLTLSVQYRQLPIYQR
jgi:squalene cyclase